MSTTTTPSAVSAEDRQARALAKLHKMRFGLRGALIERDQEIDALLVGILARQHVGYFGAPGIAKSLMVHGAAAWFGGSYFDYMLTKYSTPDEIFGPPDIGKLMEEHKLVLNPAGHILEADFVFLDEIFNASSSLLNSLLTLMNERTCRYGSEKHKARLKTLVGASNRYPGGETATGTGAGAGTGDPGERAVLDAMFDRIMIRLDIHSQLTRGGMLRLLTMQDPPQGPADPEDLIHDDDQACLIDLMQEVEVSDHVLDTMVNINQRLIKEELGVSPRRMRNSVQTVKAVALLEGRIEVKLHDLMFLRHVYWNDVVNRDKVRRIIGQYADPHGLQLTEEIEAVQQAIAAADMENLSATEQAQLVEKIRTSIRKVEQLAKKVEDPEDRFGTAIQMLMDERESLTARMIVHTNQKRAAASHA